jgi:hypothetical protein
MFKRYPAPAYALFFEVHNSTGYSRSRSADALAMGLWPSRGLELHGFEFKVSRGDWLNELKNPAKAESIAKYCDYWWLVCGDESVAKKDEIPTKWGHLNLKGNRLMSMKDAPKLEAEQITRGFLAAILRRQHENVLEAPEVRAKLESMRKEMKDQEKDKWSFEAKEQAEELERLKSTVAEFELRSGIKIGHKWQAGKVGDAVREVMSVQALLDKTEDSLNRAKEVHGLLTNTLNGLQADIQKLQYVKELAEKLQPQA